MNHLGSNAGTVHTEGSGDAPEWQGLVQKDAHLRQTLQRWHTKDDEHPHGGPKVSKGRDRKIVGSSRHLLSLRKEVGPEETSLVKEATTTPPMLTPQPTRLAGNQQDVDAPKAHHFVSKPNVSPKRMKNMTGLDVPSLNLTKQRSLRQPNERADIAGIVSRSKSEQVNNRAHTMGTRKSVAKRGLSVRRLPSSEVDFSVATQDKVPEHTSSFISVSTSMTDKLGNLDEEDPSVTVSPTISKESPINECGEMKETKIKCDNESDEVDKPGATPPTAADECPSSPRQDENLPYLSSSPLGGGLLQPKLSTPKRRDSISPFARKPLNVRDLLGNQTKELACLSPTLHVVSQHGRVELQTKTREELSNGPGVARSKSEQVTCLTHRQGNHVGGPAKILAHRGLSVRNLPGSSKGKRSMSQSSHSATSHTSRRSGPARATSFASITTSVVMKIESPKESEKRMLPLLEENLCPSSKVTESGLGLGATNAEISKPCPHPSSVSGPTRSSKPREINLSLPLPLSPAAGDKRVTSLSARVLSPLRSRSRENSRTVASPKPDKTRKSPPLDLPPALMSMPVHSARSLSPKPQNVGQKDSKPNRMDSPREFALNGSAGPSPNMRPTISPARSTRSMRALLTRSPSKTRNRTDLSRSPVRNRPKSPVPSRSSLRPCLSKRLLSMRSIVSVNTNVAVSEEVYPNKAKRPAAVPPASLSRDSSGGTEYAAKAVHRKSLLARLGGSFRLAAGAALEDDDITKTSAEDDESNIGETEQNSKPRALVKRQASRRSLRPPNDPDPDILVQKQNERKSLLTRLSRRHINDEKTECSSVSQGVTIPRAVRPEPPQQEETKRDSYVPEFIYFRQFSSPEENQDDASVITEAFTLVYEGESENEGCDGSCQKSERASHIGRGSNCPSKSSEQDELPSVVDACSSILGDIEPSLMETEDPDEIVNSLLNSSPRPRVRVPRLKSLRTQSIRTKTIWNLEDSDGSLYIDNPEHQDAEKEETILEDGEAYLSEVMNELAKVKSRESLSSSDESISKRKKKSKKRTPRRVDSADRVLIEL